MYSLHPNPQILTCIIKKLLIQLKILVFLPLLLSFHLSSEILTILNLVFLCVMKIFNTTDKYCLVKRFIQFLLADSYSTS